MTRADNFFVFWPLIAFALLYGTAEFMRAYFHWKRRNARRIK